jgi:glyoxylase-like metal-dependent hydrolase (beta-lactamase superfamily II)
MMNHLETQEIIKDIYAIKTKDANFFVVNHGEGYIAIDAGCGKSIAKDELRKLNIEPEKITSVLLTHTDFDHIAALGLFKNATIYISKQEVQMIDGTTSRLYIFKNKLKYDYKVIENNEELYFGKIKVKSILTPGHTNGSMSFVLDDKYLFVGDNLSLNNSQIELFNSFFNMNDSIQKESIEKLAQIKNIEFIFTAHYGFIDDCKDAFKNFQ